MTPEFGTLISEYGFRYSERHKIFFSAASLTVCPFMNALCCEFDLLNFSNISKMYLMPLFTSGDGPAMLMDMYMSVLDGLFHFVLYLLINKLEWFLFHQT